MSDENKIPTSLEAALRRIEEKKQPQSFESAFRREAALRREAAQQREAALRIEKKEKEPGFWALIWAGLKVIALLVFVTTAAPDANAWKPDRRRRRN